MTGIKCFRIERPLLRMALVVFLLAPYWLWFTRVHAWSAPSAAVWAPAMGAAFAQALISTILSLAFGFLFFQAAQGWPRAWAEGALLLPNVVPPIFLALALLAWRSPFPYGLGAVIVAHVLLNSGLAAVSFERMVHGRVGGLGEVAWLMGTSKRAFWTEVAWPLLRGEVACLFLFIFSLCWTSFSLPLLLGGGRWSTLEVAIYDLIRHDARWDQALLLAAGQSLLLLALAWLLPRDFWPERSGRRALGYLGLGRGGRWLAFLPATIVVGGWLWGLRLATPEWTAWPWFAGLLTTLALGLSVGLLHVVLFLLTAYVLPHARLTRFLNGYLAPSAVLTGFALLFVPGAGENFMFVKLSFALTLISFPLLYRWIVHGALSAQHASIEVARTLGASWSMILFEVVWPTTAPAILRASGLAAAWAAGDFALTGILAGPLNTLPRLMAEMIGRYQLGAAESLLFPLLLAGLGLYGLFVGAARYVGR